MENIKTSCRAAYRFRLAWSLVVMVPLFFSCERKLSHQKTLYPIDSLVNAQVRLLSSSHASVFKSVMMKGKKDTVTIRPDSVGWNSELDIFRELKSVNKPVNLAEYKVERLNDSRSNLRIKSITTEEDLPIRSLKIFYQDHEEKIRRIEADYFENNSMYGSKRTLILEFEDVRNQPVLSSYKIEGDQKMFLADSVAFYVKGTVSLPKL